MTISGIDYHASRIAGTLKAWDISIGIYRYLKLLDFLWLYIKAPYRNLGIIFACFRIFVAIFARVCFIFLMFRFHTLEELKRICFDSTFVELYPAKHGAIGIEFEGWIKGKFLFVNPVWQTIYNMIEFAILSNLALAIIVEKFYEEDVVVANECHLQSIWRPYRHLLFATFREFVESVILHIIDVINSLERATIYWFGLSLDKHTLAIRRHDVTIKTLDALAYGIVQQHSGLLTCLKWILHNLLAVGRNLGILVGTLQRVDATNTLCCKSAVGDRLDIYLLGSINGSRSH